MINSFLHTFLTRVIGRWKILVFSLSSGSGARIAVYFFLMILLLFFAAGRFDDNLLALACSETEKASVARPTQKPHALSKLQTLIGNWEGKAINPATQWDQGFSSPLKVRFRWILDDYHLLGVFRYTLGGMPYRSRTFWSYDCNTERYTLHWIDNHSSVSTTFEGAFADDGSLVLKAKRMMGLQLINERFRLVFKSDDKWQLISESDVQGDYVVGIILDAVRSE